MSAVSSREAVIARLPRTMAASMREQLARANLLFPVERRLLEGRLDWLERLDRRQFDTLFATVIAIESRMQLPARTEPGSSIEQSAIIARSSSYPEWRREVERVFTVIDDGAEHLHPAHSFPRLLICVLPPGLPVHGEQWRDAPPGGLPVSLQKEFGDFEVDLMAALAHRECASELTPVETTWIVACESRADSRLTPATVIGWDDTAKMRRIFLDRLNDVNRTLHSVDEAMSALERLDLSAVLPSRLTADPRVREFIRSLLLSGNGSLVLNNSFVQWCASEALRRAQPQVLAATFGIRNKPKPFSSLAWFEDQTRANPSQDQPDPEGSMIDDVMLSRYVYFTARRLKPYAGHMLAWFATADSKSSLVFPPNSAKAPMEWTGHPLSASEARDICLNWLTRTSE